MTVATFMREVLLNSSYGYYTNKEHVLGQKGMRHVTIHRMLRLYTHT
jgi:hypothetical protein